MECLLSATQHGDQLILSLQQLVNTKKDMGSFMLTVTMMELVISVVQKKIHSIGTKRYVLQMEMILINTNL